MSSGRAVAEQASAVNGGVVIEWARSLDAERLWALEDCRHLTRGLERTLLEAGERLVRVPPRLTAPQRRRGRVRGKSDRIDALAVARSALQEPLLDAPRAGEETLRELKLLVDPRDDLGRSIGERDRELHARVATIAQRPLELPRCGPLSAAKLLCEIGPLDRFGSDAQLARHAGIAPHDASSGKHQRHRLDRGGNRQLNCALHRIAITQARAHPPARVHLERKQNKGNSRREAIHCLKRQLARTVYTTPKAESALT